LNNCTYLCAFSWQLTDKISYDSDPDRLSTLSPASVEGETTSPSYPSVINNVHTATIAIPNGNGKVR
jgi:hypothetical protein